MRRWAWNIFAAASLLIFILAMTLWVRSWFVGERIVLVLLETDSTEQPIRNLSYELEWARGALRLSRERYELGYAGIRPGWYRFQQRPPVLTWLAPSSEDRVHLRLAEFHLVWRRHSDADGWTSEQILVLPLWLLAGAAAMPPLLWWRRWRRSRGRGFPVQAAGSEPLATGH